MNDFLWWSGVFMWVCIGSAIAVPMTLTAFDTVKSLAGAFGTAFGAAFGVAFRLARNKGKSP